MKFIEKYLKNKELAKKSEGFDFNNLDIMYCGISISPETKARLADTYKDICNIMCTHQHDNHDIKDLVTVKILKKLASDPELMRIKSFYPLSYNHDENNHKEHSIGTIALSKGYLDIVKYILDVESDILRKSKAPHATIRPLQVNGENLAMACAKNNQPELAISILDNSIYRMDEDKSKIASPFTIGDWLLRTLYHLQFSKDDKLTDTEISKLRMRYIDALSESIKYDDLLTHRRPYDNNNTLAHDIAEDYRYAKYLEPIVKEVLGRVTIMDEEPIREFTNDAKLNVMDILICQNNDEITQYIKDTYDYDHSDYLERIEQNKRNKIANEIDDILGINN